ncbi:MAG: ABC transporter ATP-binding protein [Pyrinomonadaceae bacterium]|nr:ABC transporter ATP-binding protein [Pyrinomonadaceae bacterium]
MSDFAITVEGLSKRYHIGEKRSSYKTLRETLTVPFQFKSLRSRFGSKNRHRSGGTSSPGSFWALKDISFGVKRGEVVGVIGRNGAGKSTLLKILSRITNPTEGHADIRGRVGSLLEVGTGFHPELTGRENIFLNGAILGMRRAEIERQFDEMVAFAEVEKFIDTPVKHYSTGLYLRLAFAVAAHLEPEILLIDEVLAVGDMRFQKKCLGKMEEVAAHGRTVLFVSHNLGAIKELCKSCLVLSNGRIDYQGPVGRGLMHYSQAVMANDDGEPSRKTVGWSETRIEGPNSENAGPLASSEHFSAISTLYLADTFDRVRLYCLIDDSSSNSVVHHFVDFDRINHRRLLAGHYQVRAEFPPLWLMPDVYTVHFKMIGVGASVEDARYHSERVILDVVDTAGQSVGNVRAVLIPPVKWSMNSELQNEQEKESLVAV